MTGEAAAFSWGRVWRAAYLPIMLTGAAVGAATPVAALRASELGADLRTAALIVALVGVGQLLGAVPSGALVARIGERATLVRAGALDAAALLVVVLAQDRWVLAAALLASGLASSAFFVARQGFMIDVLPPERLARGMSLLGGSMRVGFLLGPLVGAIAAHLWGTRGALAAAFVFSLGSVVLIATGPSLGRHDRGSGGPTPIGAVLRRHARTFLTVGTVALVIAGLRQSRSVLLPLWATFIGLDGARTSLAFVLAGIVEVAVVYPAGWLMDHRGRTVVAGALVAMVSTALVLLPAVGGFTGFALVASLVGIGNGFGSGILMTLGADAAPAADRAQFLGGWRLCGEAGNAAAPLVVTAVTAVASLSAAAWVLGGIGLVSLPWVVGVTRRLDARRHRAGAG